MKQLRLLITSISLAALLATAADAATLADRKPAKLEDRGNVGSLSDRTFKRLTKAQLLLADQKFPQALELLAHLEDSAEKQPFTLAQVLQVKGFVYAQMSKYDEALEALEGALALNAMPLRGTLSTMVTTAQIYMAKEDFAKAIPLLQDVIFNADQPKSRHYVALAQCYAATKLYKAGVKAIEAAIKLEPQPKETWLQLLVAMNYNLKDYDGAIAGLQRLIKIDPEKKKYWKQLSTIYMSAGRDRQAVATMEIAYKKGFLKEEKELGYFLSLLYHNEVPWKAAKWMEQEIAEGRLPKNHKNYQLLANFWTRSQYPSQALEALAKAAPLAKDGKTFVHQGNLYLSQDKYAEARQAFQQGIQKGNLNKPGAVYLSLGISQFHLKDFSGALASFEKAKSFDKTKQQADQWIAHVKSESH